MIRRRRAFFLSLPASGLLVLLLGWLDVATGYELNFSTFYLAPIAIAAWVGGAVPALLLSVLSAATYAAADVLSGHLYSSPLYLVWNSLIRLASFTLVALLLADRRRAHAREFTLARTDALTGLANARHFNEVLDAELKRSRRYRRALSLVYIDLDNFKVVNDTSGHAAGDSLLLAMATAMQHQLRDVDTAARLGGDEFAVVLPEADPEAAASTARRVHLALRNTAAQAGFPVSASVGVVTCRTAPRSRDHLLHLADELMYSVKRTSKDSVVCSVYDLREARAG